MTLQQHHLRLRRWNSLLESPLLACVQYATVRGHLPPPPHLVCVISGTGDASGARFDPVLPVVGVSSAVLTLPHAPDQWSAYVGAPDAVAVVERLALSAEVVGIDLVSLDSYAVRPGGSAAGGGGGIGPESNVETVVFFAKIGADVVGYFGENPWFVEIVLIVDPAASVASAVAQAVVVFEAFVGDAAPVATVGDDAVDDDAAAAAAAGGVRADYR